MEFAVSPTMLSLSSTAWFVIIGALLIAMAVISPRLDRWPLTAPLIYLVLGIALGPLGLEAFHFDPLRRSGLFETLAEVAVLVSLFAAGGKMPLPFDWSQWRAPVLLAWLGMVVTILVMAAFGYFVLQMPIGVALLLGAVLAPTDPVLATEIQSRYPGDRDELRFALTCEAGINDGGVFPFVMLGLGLVGVHELGTYGWHWLIFDALYASVAGIGVGFAFGWVGGRLVARTGRDPQLVFEDFLGMGLIAVSFGVAEAIGATGFLAVFFAGVALRRTELAAADRLEPPESRRPREAEADGRLISESSVVFQQNLGRGIEVLLVLFVGGALLPDFWSWQGLALTLFLFLVARPAGVLSSLVFAPTPTLEKTMISWFGLRGIGSLYYLMFALEAGVSDGTATLLLHTTFMAVTLSILLHGISAAPLIRRYASRGRAVRIEGR